MADVEPTYSESPYRFINAVIFCLSGLANSLIVQTFSPISIQVQQYCKVSELVVNMCALVFMILHPIVTFPTNYILNRWGLKIGCNINCIFVIVGVGLRCLVKESFTWVLLGNILVAAGNAFMLNAPSQFSANWFKPENRMVVTSVAVFFLSVSGAAGALLSPFVVKPGLSDEEGIDSVERLMLLQGAIIAFIMLLNLVFFRGKPKTPPAPSAQKHREDFLPSLKGLIHSRNYILMYFAMMFLLGTSNAYSVTIGPFLQPFGITSEDAGIGMALSVCFGLIGSVVSSIYVRRTKKYTRTIRFEFLLGAVAMGGIIIPLFLGNQYLYWIEVCFMGFFIYPIGPAIIELSCQSVFPIGESICTGFLLTGGQLFGFLLGVIQSLIIKGENKQQSIIGLSIYVSMILCGFAIFWFVKQDLKRMTYQQANQMQSSLLSQQI